MGFTPDQPNQGAGFTPDLLQPEDELKGLPQPETQGNQLDFQELTRQGAGFIGEAALGEGAKYAGATAGAALGSAVPVLGTAIGGGIGYVVGGLGGGYGASVARQKLVNPDKPISYGEAIGDALINLIPFDDLIKGGKLLTRVGKSAAGGGIVGEGSLVAETLIDEQRLPTAEELKERGINSVAFGSALGVGQEILPKLLGKTTKEIDSQIQKGDKDLVNLKNTLDQYTLGEQNFKGMMAAIAPSKTVGKEITGITRQAPFQQQAAKTEASYLGEKVQNFINKSENPEIVDRQAEQFLRFGVESDEIKPIIGELSKARDLIEELQVKALNNHYTGEKILGEDTVAAIERSLNEGDYLTKEYRYFTDPNYRPTKEQTEALLRSYKNRDEGLQALRELEDSRLGVATQGEGVDGIFKKRQNLSPQMRAYLGEITQTGERLRGTLDRLSNATIYSEADSLIKEQLQGQGVAKLATQVGNDPNFVPLNLRRGNQVNSLTQEQLYVPKDYQDALNSLYAQGFDEFASIGHQKWWNDLYETAISGAKAGKVLGNPPAFAVNYWSGASQLAGLGFNPIKNIKEKGLLSLADLSGNKLNDKVRKWATEQLGSEALEKIKKAIELGLIQGNVLESDIRAGLQKGKLGAGLEKVTNPLGKVYNIPDNMFRMIAWEQQMDKLKRIFPNATKEQLEVRAADDINDMFQNYSRLSNLTKFLSRKGVLGQFSAFPLELSRNTYNQGKHITEMISGRYGQKHAGALGGVINQREATKAGYKQMAAMGLMTAGLAAGINEVNKRTTGLSKEELDAQKRSLLPSYDVDKTQIFLPPTKDGKIRAMNASYLAPQMQLTGVFEAGMQGEDFIDAIGNVAKAAYNEIGGEGTFVGQNLAGAIANVDLERRKKISSDPRMLQQFMDRTSFMLDKTFQPGIVREFNKALENPLSNTLARQTGFRINTYDPNVSMSLKGRELQENLRGIKSDLASARFNNNPLAFERSVGVLKENFDVIQQHVNDYKAAGFSEDEIVQKFGKELGRKITIQAIDGVFEAPQFQEPEKISDVLDQMNSLNTVAERKQLLSQYPREFQVRVVEKLKRLNKGPKLTEREKLVKSMGSADGERVEFVLKALPRQENPRAFIANLYKKKALNEADMERILQALSVDNSR